MAITTLRRWPRRAGHKSVGTRDAATGLLNATAFDVVAQHALRRAHADALPAALVCIRLGGEPPPGLAEALECADSLRLAASLLSEETRGEDVLARTGTRELCALLPGYDAASAAAAAERLRATFNVVGAFRTEGGVGGTRATTVGWATTQGGAAQNDALDALCERARSAAT